MIFKYVTKIRAKLNIYTRQKTDNLLDGSYQSSYQGNGFDFENLREYIPGDNIRDIDWKASSRSGKMLVKRYVAQRTHDIMLVLDSGKKMTAHSKELDLKKDLALNVGGVLGYLSAKNGDSVGMVYNRNGMIQYHRPRTGIQNVEQILTCYDKEKFDDYEADLEKCLTYIVNNIRQKMIIFVITDVSGIRNVSDTTLKKLASWHDVLFISLTDADYTESQSEGRAKRSVSKYKAAINLRKNSYIPEFLARNKKLIELEQELKERIAKENEKKLIRYRIACTEIDSDEEMVDKIVELLANHRYVNNRKI